MPVNASLDEPTIPPQLRRPLAAAWISLGLHAALVALVQVAPPASLSLGEPVIEARLVTTHATPPTVEAPPLAPAVAMPDDTSVPLLAPSETAEALPVAEPVVAPPAQPAPLATAAQPVDVPAEPAVSVSEAAPPAPVSAPAASTPVPAATITTSVDLTYYSAREVDVQARPLREIDLKYPDAADRKRLSGKVRLKLKIDADGRVSDMELVSATHPDLYDESTLKVIIDTPFSPGKKNGRQVRQLYEVEVEYDWEGRPR